MNLIRLALSYAPRWAIQKLTATYITLSLSEIAQAINLTEDDVQGAAESAEDVVRGLVLNMVNSLFSFFV